jgi:hypothetical protein
LWSKREGIVTGVAASAIHRAEWVDDDVPVELIWNCTRPPGGIVTRNERIADDEISWTGHCPSPRRRALPSILVGFCPAARPSHGWTP